MVAAVKRGLPIVERCKKQPNGVGPDCMRLYARGETVLDIAQRAALAAILLDNIAADFVEHRLRYGDSCTRNAWESADRRLVLLQAAQRGRRNARRRRVAKKGKARRARQ